MARPVGSKGTKAKRFGDALSLAVASSQADALKDFDPDDTTLRGIAQALAVKALGGDIPAIKEVADRLDGKVPQTIGGDPDNPIEHVGKVTWEIVAPKAKGG